MRLTGTLATTTQIVDYFALVAAMRSEQPITLKGHTGIVRGISAESGGRATGGVTKWNVKFHNLDSTIYVELK